MPLELVLRPLTHPRVRRQGEGPHGGLQLQLVGGRVAAAAHGPDLDVELLRLFVVVVRVTGVKVVLFVICAAWGRSQGSYWEATDIYTDTSHHQTLYTLSYVVRVVREVPDLKLRFFLTMFWFLLVLFFLIHIKHFLDKSSVYHLYESMWFRYTSYILHFIYLEKQN